MTFRPAPATFIDLYATSYGSGGWGLSLCVRAAEPAQCSEPFVSASTYCHTVIKLTPLLILAADRVARSAAPGQCCYHLLGARWTADRDRTTG